MKRFFSVVLAFTIVFCTAMKGYARPEGRPSSPGDFSAALEKGKDLFNKAYYEEAGKEFLLVAGSDGSPCEDKIKAHYYLMKIHRAYGNTKKVTSEIREILRLSPVYTLSKREPSSLRKLFEEVRGELFKEKEKDEAFEKAQQLHKELVVLEQKITAAASGQDAFRMQVKKQGEEVKKLKASFYITSITLFLLLAINASFR